VGICKLRTSKGSEFEINAQLEASEPDETFINEYSISVCMMESTKAII
jgi:hypothetical protein